jgi:hypothetical protein
MTAYDRGHAAADRLIKDHKFVRGMLNPELLDFNLAMMRSLLYIAWRRGWQASAKYRKQRKSGGPNGDT